MGRETPIWLGELFDSLRILRPRDEAGCQRIAHLLGVEPRELQPGSQLLAAMGEVVAAREPRGPSLPSKSTVVEAAPDAPVSAVRLSRTRQAAARRRRTSSWRWLAAVDPLPPPAKVEPRKPRPPDPLLEPRESRAIWSAALHTNDSPGDIDLDALVVEICAGRPVRQAPRLRVPRMARRVDVLIDLAPSMDPFALDWRGLVDDLRNVAGRDTVETWFFEDCPARGTGLDDPLPGKPYVPSAPGIATLILSDFGLGPVASGRLRPTMLEWLDCLEQIAAAGAFPLGLVPYPDWPDALVRALPLIHWDRRTSAAQVHRAVGDHRNVTS